MDSNRKTAIIVGVLFIVATVTSSLYYVIVTPVLDASDYLAAVSENQSRVVTGVLLYLIDCVAVVFIPIMLFPIFKKHNEALSLGYVGFRIIESVTLVVGHIALLALLSLSREYAPDSSHFQASGALLMAVTDWSHLLGIEIVFSITALILNCLLYRSKLVPRFISVWGLIGAVLLLVSGLLRMFDTGISSTVSMVFNLPIAINEMVLAVWLIGKGFNQSAVSSGSA